MLGPSTPAIGSDIGAYRVEALLGRGGMGVVYRATDNRLGRKVALKVLPPEYGEDRTFRARFLRESRVAASLDHPGVIPIFEAGDDGGQLYIAMRYVDGTDLARLLSDGGPLDPERALTLTGQLAAALDAAHACGLVHRDVKPSNALVAHVDQAEHVYLCDFGLSKEAAGDTTLSASGTVMGTLRYMAPEVIRSGESDARSDLYSLGCVLFECLTGEAPFEGASQAAIIYGHLEEPPPRVSEKRPGLPRALDGVLARALDKDPERRWASGAELMEAARAALAGRPVQGERVRGSRRRVLGAALAVLLAVLAGAFALTRDSRDATRLATVTPDAIAIIDPGEGSLTEQVALDGAPAAIAEGAGAVWATDEERGVVSRVDKETFTIRDTIRVGHGPSAVAADYDGVWVANRQDGTVSVISPQTNEVVETIPVGRTVDGLCIGSGSVWVASPLDYAVVRLDPESLLKADTVRLGVQPAQLACGNGVVWASSPSSGLVTEISATGPERTIQVGRGASAIAPGANAVWVTNAADGTVSRIDRRRGVVNAVIPVGAADGPAHLAVTEDAVWVSSEFGGTVSRIDPARPQDGVVEKFGTGNRPQGLAVIDRALWVGVADAGARHRGGTLRLEYPPVVWEDLDPSTSYWGAAYELLNLTNDGLTAYRRQGGGDSATPVANLAVALPTPSEGGRRYAFRLRRGIRYSTGEPVRASDIRFGLERALPYHQVAKKLLSSIRGARACTPKRCDLSRGIVTDDAAGTVVFRLTEPDGDLLTKLALPFASALPPSAGRVAPAKRVLPATGPYVITEFEPRRFVRLERNPRFKSWSRAARPDGYPDVITARLGEDTKAAVERVLAGRSDRVLNPTLGRAQRSALRRRVPAQLRATVSAGTYYFMLNTRRPPFDSLDARRAVAFAFDRRAAVTAAGGREFEQENCQVLPPNFPGSRPYCPYTTSGTATGRPDLKMARRLVRRSGTNGTRVTVITPDWFMPTGVSQLMTRTLRQIGYDATVRVLPADRYFPTLYDTGKRTQIGISPWGADYPGASTFLQPFTCDGLTPNSPDNLNPSQFCDPEVDRMIEEATRLQAVDPGAADALWARAEHAIVDQAPAVGVYSDLSTDLVSPRLGNYQFNPWTNMLLDQAWVR